jgi:hypothetical protein
MRARILAVISKSISRDKHQTAVTKLRFSWESRNAIGYAIHYSRSADAVIRVYDAAGNVIQGTSTKAIAKEP